jgi:hypothetical protein
MVIEEEEEGLEEAVAAGEVPVAGEEAEEGGEAPADEESKED